VKRRAGGLGRGLDALLPSAPAGGGVLELPVDAIVPNPVQPREQMAAAALEELADSIRVHGVLQPLIVTRGESGYVLIAGERRWRAAQLAGLQVVPALLKEVTPQERLELALIENVQRQDLSPLEEAAAYEQLVTEHGLTQEAVAARVGKSRVAVTNALRQLHLTPAARAALLEGWLTAGHARALLATPDPATQERLAAEVVARELSVRETEELVRRVARADRPAAAAPSAAAPAVTGAVEAAALEQRLRQALGTKVQLERTRRGGRIVIHYYSDDELQGLVERLLGS
jgi:ParB family chromosome partitioning protein